MARFDNAIALATKLITKNGQPGVLTRSSEVPDDVDEPWNGGTVTDTPEDVIVVTFPLEEKEDDTLNLGNFTEKDAKWVIMAAEGVSQTPAPKDKLAFTSEGSQKTWNIDSLSVLDPNGQQIIYELIVIR